MTFGIAVDRAQHVDVSIHDLSGRRVATLHHGVLDPGERVITWNGMLMRGRHAAPGIYLVRFHGDRISESRRMRCSSPRP